MTTPFRRLLQTNPEQVKKRLHELRLEGKSAKEIAELLGVEYPTFYSLVKEFGIIRRSSLELVSDEEWSRLSKQQIAKAHLTSFNHVYNYHKYHKEEIDARVRAYRERTSQSPVDE